MSRGTVFGILVSVGAAASIAALAHGQTETPRIVVDQFGYATDATKVIVVRRPQIGYDAPSRPDLSLPGPMLEVVRASDGQVVATAPITAWNNGGTDSASGDRVWWADVSGLTDAGEYVARDPATGDASARFRVAAEPYRDAARVAVRMFYYQRCGVAKDAQHAGAAWADGVCHAPDATLTWIADPAGSDSIDVSGGWHDAGDYNKYVNFADDVVHELLDAWRVAPELWTDDFGIPESGNGRPDLLDEIAFELAWLARMQLADGSALHKVSVPGYQGASPASADTITRYYASPTATATMSIAGAFAHAAVVFGALGDAGSQTLAADYRERALRAWDWVEANPQAWAATYDNDGGLFTTVSAEEDAYTRSVSRVRAAVHLWRLTGEARFRDVVDAEYGSVHAMQWYTLIPFESYWHEPLLLYADTPGATPAVAADVRDVFAFALARDNAIGRHTQSWDAYRAWLEPGDYVWASNRVRAHQGANLALAARYGLAEGDDARPYRDAAAAYLHALHGVNPQGMAFLTNLGLLGIESSANEMYHGWFADGTVWDNAQTSQFGPPPGFLTGGPNPTYAPATAIVVEPPMNQPALKSYLDWNADWPESSWQVTECHIPYQSAYIRLLADVTALSRTVPVCAADLSGDGVLNNSDINAFVQAFLAGEPAADLSGDGVLNNADINAFVQAFLAGC